MGLNIKNERVHELARELAAMRGKSMTAVIEEALEEKLDRELAAATGDRGESDSAFDRYLKTIAKGPAAPKGVTSDHDDMYDKDGLPIW